LRERVGKAYGEVRGERFPAPPPAPTPTSYAMPTRTHAPQKTTLACRRSHRPAKPTATGTPDVRILTFNVSVAAEPRATRILRWLRRRRDHLIVLSETNGGPGTELLRAGLVEDGYRTFAAPDPTERGVLLASRLPVRKALAPLPVTLPARAQGVVLDTPRPFAIIGVYIPSRDRSPAKVTRKRHFISSLLRVIESFPESRRRDLLLLGDYNAVARDHKPALPGFFPYEYGFHDHLAKLGLNPAHELRPWGQGQPHSWIGRTGIGYLYDYAHLGGAVGECLLRCRYLHGPRNQRLSDHAALSLTLRLN
jgi:exodeoxyribonuclease-3